MGRTIAFKTKRVNLGHLLFHIRCESSFALPLLLLGRGWRRKQQWICKFNLFGGLFIPFVLCSSSLTILSAIAHQNFLKNNAHQSLITLIHFIVHETSGPVHDLLAERIKQEIGDQAFDALPPFQQEEKISHLSNHEKILAQLVMHTTTKHWVELLSDNDNSFGKSSRDFGSTYIFFDYCYPHGLEWSLSL